MMNSYVNAQTNLKKLQFGPEKCKQLHVGKEGQKCQSLTVEKWIEFEVQNDELDKVEIVDKWDGNITINNGRNRSRKVSWRYHFC